MRRQTNVVCFGGGTGLPALLSGIKHNPLLNITAVVNMFDTGGSSGELRDRFGILPPGDILKCLLALSEDAEYARKLLLKRIKNRNFDGHTGGNLLLMALESVYGDYDDAISALSQILSVRGTVIPVTQLHSTLCAVYTDGTIHQGEIAVDAGICEGKEIVQLSLDPVVKASPRAIEAIEGAEAFCIGPGSFYTSVISNLLPQGIRDAIAQSNAPIIFISNFLTEGSGMEGFTIKKATEILEQYLGRSVAHIIANTQLPEEAILKKYEREHKRPIVIEGYGDSRLVCADLWCDTQIARHDSARLAHLVYSILYCKKV